MLFTRFQFCCEFQLCVTKTDEFALQHRITIAYVGVVIEIVKC